MVSCLRPCPTQCQTEGELTSQAKSLRKTDGLYKEILSKVQVPKEWSKKQRLTVTPYLGKEGHQP